MKRLSRIWRAVIETGFIIFLFYSNLLMGQFTRSNSVDGKSLLFAIGKIFTITNFVIGIICALIGYIVVEYLRKKLYVFQIEKRSDVFKLECPLVW